MLRTVSRHCLRLLFVASVQQWFVWCWHVRATEVDGRGGVEASGWRGGVSFVCVVSFTGCVR